MLPRKLAYSLIPSKLVQAVQRHRVRHSIVEGTPEGITRETLSSLCRERLGEPVRLVSYVHLSGWKSLGTFRLFIETAKGQRWNLIYKNAMYDRSHMPALEGLPVLPGPPEYKVYRHPGCALAAYLPEVYFCSEVIPGRHYQYLLEDVTQQYRRVQYDRSDILMIVSQLPALHQAIGEWSATAGRDHLLRFDRHFSMGLLAYAIESLERYAKETADREVSDVCRFWPEISELYQRREYQELSIPRPIHGDFNTANIFVHVRDSKRIKVMDWEWAGLGVVHADLASLLKSVEPAIQQQALRAFSRLEPYLSASDHQRLYRWCQLERGLLDAAFLAKQQMEPSTQVGWIPGYIQASMRRVLNVYQELAQ